MLEIHTIANLYYAVSRVWTCAEPEFRLSWIKLCSSDNHYRVSNNDSGIEQCSWWLKYKHNNIFKVLLFYAFIFFFYCLFVYLLHAYTRFLLFHFVFFLRYQYFSGNFKKWFTEKLRMRYWISKNKAFLHIEEKSVITQSMKILFLLHVRIY